MKKIIFFVCLNIFVFVRLFAPYIYVHNCTVYPLECVLSQDSTEIDAAMCLAPSSSQIFHFDGNAKKCALSVASPEAYSSFPGYLQRFRKTCFCDRAWKCEIFDRVDKRELMLQLTPLIVNYQRYQLVKS